jgi:hypothetical protein
MNVKTGAVLILMAFAVTLAYSVGTRMSTDAVNVAVGVLCGIVASVPVSLGLLVALTRQRARAYDDEPREDLHPTPVYGSPRHQAPQIIVVAPPQSQYGPGQPTYGYPYPNAASYSNYAPSQHEDVIESRDWRIIGDDEG